MAAETSSTTVPRRALLGAAVWRGLVVLHRYLGVAVGIVMTLWCLSGVVMIYSGYPRLAEAERLRGLAPLQLATCCADVSPALARVDGIRRFNVEMLVGRPVLRLTDTAGRRQLIDLRTGAATPGADEAAAQTIASGFAAAKGVHASVRAVRLIDKDQWTVQDAARRGPVWRIAFADPPHTQVYVARRSGEVVQVTTAKQRFWGWLGAVPHWLYPTVLRQNGELWSQVVIWTSTAGVFLTAIGLYIGVARLKRYRSGRWSPYRGLFWWHHMTGLVFGLLTLAWVATGLLTMNPWGLLDSMAGLTERQQLAGPIDKAELARLVAALPGSAGQGARSLRAAPLAGQLFLATAGGDGKVTRLDAAGRVAPLDAAALAALLPARLGAPVGEMRLVTRPDAYNYDGYDRLADLPAYRVDVRDAGKTTLYLDPRTGEVMRAVDDTERLSRWTRTAFHDWDFAATRARPWWDLLVLAMLAGAAATCALGAWMGLRRAKQDLARLRR